MPLKPGTLIFEVCAAIRQYPGMYVGRDQIRSILPPNNWKPNSVTGALTDAWRQGGPVERMSFGVYRYVPERDSAEWGLGCNTNLVPGAEAPVPTPLPEEPAQSEAPASKGTFDREVILCYRLGTTVDDEDIVQSEDGVVGFIRWVA